MRVGAVVPLDATVTPDAAFSPVAGDPVLVRVVRALLGDRSVATSEVVVVAAEGLAAQARECLAAADLSAVVLSETATATRRECLVKGLDHLGREPHSSTCVLVGDHRHPLASAELTDRVISGLLDGHQVVVPMLPLTDTVKAVDERGLVLSTVDRTPLRTVQSPCGYQYSALAQLLADEGDADELTGALAAGLRLTAVEGAAEAFAADLPADVELLDAISAARRQAS